MISVVIPNWNGKALLEENLPAVLAAVDAFAGEAEIIVADDGSDDGSASFLAERFPSVRVVRSETNRGFQSACQMGVEAAKGEVVVLLNSDVAPKPDFLGPLTEHFDQPNVFGVSCLSFAADGTSLLEAVKVPYFRRGLLRFLKPASPKHPEGIRLDELTEAMPTLFATGGHAAFRRAQFLQWGGFDELYAPFYGEDLDLGYRAWKRGWKVLFEPRSRVIHRHHSTIGTAFGRRRASRIHRRNRMLFIWKNVTSARMLWGRHLGWLALRLLLGFLVLDFRFYSSFFRACPRLGLARLRRQKEKRSAQVADEVIFRTIRQRWSSRR